MKILFHKKKALIIALIVGVVILNPATADDQKTQVLINTEISEEDGKISIKKIRNLSDKEFSYQNSDNNIILVKCNADKILVKYWYVTKIDSANPQEATSKMQWHRAAPKSQVQRESKLLCDSTKNQRDKHPLIIKNKVNDRNAKN